MLFRSWVRSGIAAGDLHELADGGDRRLRALELLDERIESATLTKDLGHIGYMFAI